MERYGMKSKGESIKKNSLMNAILIMSSFIFPLITFPMFQGYYCLWGQEKYPLQLRLFRIFH